MAEVPLQSPELLITILARLLKPFGYSRLRGHHETVSARAKQAVEPVWAAPARRLARFSIK
jgi:hypothetical protein